MCKKTGSNFVLQRGGGWVGVTACRVMEIRSDLSSPNYPALRFAQIGADETVTLCARAHVHRGSGRDGRQASRPATEPAATQAFCVSLACARKKIPACFATPVRKLQRPTSESTFRSVVKVTYLELRLCHSTRGHFTIFMCVTKEKKERNPLKTLQSAHRDVLTL